MKTNEIQTKFNAGELSSNIDGLVDYEPFFYGGSFIENFDIHPQGYLYRRKGTSYVNEVLYSSVKTRILKFIFNVDDVIIIELGVGYFRFYNNQSLILFTLGNTFVETDLDNIRYIQKDDVMYLLHPLRGVFKLVRISNENWTFNLLDFFRGPFQKENTNTSLTCAINNHGGVGTTGLLTTNFAIFNANYVNSLWLIKDGTNYAYLKITGYNSPTSVNYISQSIIQSTSVNKNLSTWRAGEYGLHRSFPRAFTFHEQRLVFAGSINSPQKIWFSKSSDFENFDEDVGALSVDDAFDRTIASNTNDSILWLFSDQVLIIGCSDSIWIAKPSNNSSGLSNTDIGLQKNIAFGCDAIEPAYCDNAVFYSQRGKNKLRVIGFNANQNKFSTSNVNIKNDQITYSGIKRLDYQQNITSIIWVLKENGEIAKLNFEASEEVQSWCRFKTNGIIEDMVIVPSKKEYDQIYLIVKRTINNSTKRYIEVLQPNFEYDNINYLYSDCCLTYDGRINAILTLTDTTAFSSVAVFNANSVGKEIHNLEINGRAKIITYNSPTSVDIEILRDFDKTILPVYSWGIAINKITGLNHLINTSVVVNGDGATDPGEKIVNNLGEVFLQNYAVIIHCGLNYQSIFTSMPIESRRLFQQFGSQQNKLLRINEIAVKFFQSRGGKIICDNNVANVIARTFNDEINKVPKFTNGIQKISIAGEWGYDRKFSIVQDEPQALNIKNINYELNI